MYCWNEDGSCGHRGIIMTLGEWNTRTQPKYKWKDQYEWMNAHTKMYRGDNASDCMMNAFNAGRELKENK